MRLFESIPTAEAIGRRLFSRRRLGQATAALLLTAALGACGGGDDPVEAKGPVWSASWATAPQDHNEAIPLPARAQPVAASYSNVTLRQLVRPSVGGSTWRVRFSNVTGTSSVVITAARLATSQGADQIDTATQQALRFGGQARVTLAPGTERWSDAVNFKATANSDLAVSVHLKEDTPYTTIHRTSFRTAYMASGDLSASASLPGNTTMTRYHLVTGLDVDTEKKARVLATFGDSITDGTSSTVDALQRYPDHLSRRVLAQAAGSSALSVLNLGIAGNRILNDLLGPKGVARFERDVLGQSGVSHVLILLGINDIGFPAFSEPANPYHAYMIPAHATLLGTQVVTADQMIAGYQQMIDAAQARGVKVLLGTLLPFKGAAYYSIDRETMRQTVNTWIRSRSTQGIGVVDFDAALRDATDPTALQAGYDSGDHLHPNDAGYKAMADAVDLGALN